MIFNPKIPVFVVETNGRPSIIKLLSTFSASIFSRISTAAVDKVILTYILVEIKKRT